MLVLGIDLAWGEGSDQEPANETGVVAVDHSGLIVDAGWTCGLRATLAWIDRVSRHDTLAMIDAPLVVTNTSGQRRCETQVGQRYGRWKVSANSTNLRSPRKAGVAVLEQLEAEGWRYDDGRSGPPRGGRSVSEVYPYATLVGAPELGYDVARPVYKRKPPGLSAVAFRPLRAAACDELIRRLATLSTGTPPLELGSHPTTAKLLAERSPLPDREYKHREDLIDALICAWTGLLWLAHGTSRCQVLGDDDDGEPMATIIAPARVDQRR